MKNTTEATKSLPQKQAIPGRKGANDKDPELQGEGNYTADRRYRRSAQEFLDSGKVAPAAEAAAPENDVQRREMQAAEREGKSHARK